LSGMLRRSLMACGTALLLVSGTAAAQLSADETRNAARNLAGDAKTAFEQGDFERARDLFHRAYALVQAPTIAVFEARALGKLHRLVEAEEAYTRAARTPIDHGSPEAFRQAVNEAEAELATLRPRVPRLLVVPTGAGAQHPDLVLRIDGSVVPAALRGVEVPLDPGPHTLTAAVPGNGPIEARFELVEQQHRRVEIAVPAARTPASASAAVAPVASAKHAETHEGSKAPASTPVSWQVPAGFVAGGIGVAGLATGVITGLMATSRHADASEACPAGACDPGSQGWDSAQSFRTLRTVSSVGYVVGIVGVAGGVTLLLTAPKSRPAPAVALSVNVDSVWLEGSF
jgi:hypothetical protein